MIEELRMIKDIVGDLSAVGGWVAAGVILYKFMSSMVLLIGGGWLANSIISKLFAHLKAGISKQDAENIKNENSKLKADIENMQSTHRVKLDEVKAMYKILKESRRESSAE